ncbi:hypothetical protein TcBrA4_0051480 [Trypanosoma cruzi]|nr:hypothetical protein TcBrA4_0051480 [Trypanosoma cruzi]
MSGSPYNQASLVVHNSKGPLVHCCSNNNHYPPPGFHTHHMVQAVREWYNTFDQNSLVVRTLAGTAAPPRRAVDPLAAVDTSVVAVDCMMVFVKVFAGVLTVAFEATGA